MKDKTPQELLQEAEAFFERVGFNERVQQFLETDGAKKTIDDGIGFIKYNIDAVKRNAPPTYQEKADKLYEEYVKHEENMRQDMIDNFKRRLYAMMLQMYTISGDNDELIKIFVGAIYGVGYAPFMRELQQICIEVANGAATGFVADLY